MRTVLLALVCLASLGCSSEPSRFSISGTVTIDGKPGAFARLVFTPVGPGADKIVGSNVNADEQGKFTLGDAGKNTGLEAGEFKVLFSQTLINGKPSPYGSGGKKAEKLAGETEGVPEVYRSLQSTPEKVTVGKGSTSFTFDLKKQ